MVIVRTVIRLDYVEADERAITVMSKPKYLQSVSNNLIDLVSLPACGAPRF